ncbi:MAG: glycerophosphodiester phosphodiesterase family protein [Clostridia bacterium]|nr:glycerophosphodiester phosphodiesterase family protein [Clostridia bacterium]
MDIRESAKGHILIAAHRGCCGGNIPCNTLEAFQAAVDFGADIVEIDIAPSVDKQLFVFHPGMEYPHLRTRKIIRALTSSAVKRLNYVNCDRVRTEYKISTLGEVLELLKGKCYINIDKFWTAIPEITAAVRYHGMQDQIIVKTPAEEKYLDMVESYAPELNYISMIRRKDEVTDEILKRNINYLGAEILFKSDEEDVVSDEYINSMHEKNLLIWANPIVYNCNDIIAADHTDDVAVCGDRERGWLWYAKKGIDIVQTDWLLAMRQYYKSENVL